MPFSPFGIEQPTAFVNLAKRHLRLSSDTTEEDSLIMVYVCAALEHIREVTRQEWPVDPAECPPALVAAALLIVGDLYENREAQVAVALAENKAVERLLWPHRRF